MELIQIQNQTYRDDIITLYIEAFSTGISAQYIDMEKLISYIDSFFIDGQILIALENDSLVGALLYCSLQNDKFVPPNITSRFDLKKSVYIAELMVSQEHRAKGIGTLLLNYFFVTVDKKQYRDAFIRVWEENVTAVDLYKKLGFIYISSIEQLKQNRDNSGKIIMKKTYLHKTLN